MWTSPPPATPAEFTSTSMRPSRSFTAATSSRIRSSSRTSPVSKQAAGAHFTAASQSPPSGFFRSRPAIAAPSSAKRRAHAAPMPDAAPVTNATLPASRPMAHLRGPQDSVAAAAKEPDALRARRRLRHGHRAPTPRGPPPPHELRHDRGLRRRLHCRRAAALGGARGVAAAAERRPAARRGMGRPVRRPLLELLRAARRRERRVGPSERDRRRREGGALRGRAGGALALGAARRIGELMRVGLLVPMQQELAPLRRKLALRRVRKG